MKYFTKVGDRKVTLFKKMYLNNQGLSLQVVQGMLLKVLDDGIKFPNTPPRVWILDYLGYLSILKQERSFREDDLLHVIQGGCEGALGDIDRAERLHA